MSSERGVYSCQYMDLLWCVTKQQPHLESCGMILRNDCKKSANEDMLFGSDKSKTSLFRTHKKSGFPQKLRKTTGFHGGRGGIRTHVPVKATRFRVELVMTTSILFQVFVERVRGIGPPRLAWEARTLPLSYTRLTKDILPWKQSTLKQKKSSRLSIRRKISKSGPKLFYDAFNIFFPPDQLLPCLMKLQQ